MVDGGCGRKCAVSAHGLYTLGLHLPEDEDHDPHKYYEIDLLFTGSLGVPRAPTSSQPPFMLVCLPGDSVSALDFSVSSRSRNSIF